MNKIFLFFYLPKESKTTGNKNVIMIQHVQFVNTVRVTPILGRISALYSHTIGPKEIPYPKVYIYINVIITIDHEYADPNYNKNILY